MRKELGVIMGIRSQTSESQRLRNAIAVLTALNEQDMDRELYQIVVVEQDSERRLEAILAKLADQYIFAYNPGAYNASWCRNIAASRLGKSTSALCLIDADLLVRENFLRRGLERLQSGSSAVLPHTEVFYLDEASTQAAILDLSTNSVRTENPYTGELWVDSPGGALFVDTALYHAVGGYDERFRGWGFEDKEFYDRLSRNTTIERLPGLLMHLNHTAASRQDENVRSNMELYAKLSAEEPVRAAGEMGNMELYANEAQGKSASASIGWRDWEHWNNWQASKMERWVEDEKKLPGDESTRYKLAEILRGCGNTLLDVGCGPGALWPRLEAYRPGFSWVGADITEKMLSVAHAGFPDVPVFCADASALPFGDNSFDVVLLSHVLEHVPRWVMEKAVQEAMRVARNAVVIAFYLPPAEDSLDSASWRTDGFLETRWAVGDIQKAMTGSNWQVTERLTLTGAGGYVNEVWKIQPEGANTDRILHFALTSEELTYPYYLSIVSALKTQKAQQVMLWCYGVPTGRYYPLLKDGITLKVIDKPDIPALRDKDAHFQCAHLKDLLEWRSLYEYGGMFFDLDTFSLKDAAELLDDSCEVVAALECEDVDKYEDSCHMGIVMAKRGSPIIKEIWKNAIEATRQPDMIWNATGGRYGRVFKKYRDKVKFTEWGVLGGHGDKVVNWWLEDGYVWDQARILHLYGKGMESEFKKICEEYIRDNQSVYARLVRQTLTKEEWGPYIKDEVMRVHFPLTGGELTYSYYLAIVSALKTQHAEEFILWCFEEPKGKYWQLVKDRVKLGIVSRPDFPVLREKDEYTQGVFLKDYFQARVLYEIGGMFMDLDTLCVSDVCDMLTEDYEVVSPLTCELGFQIENPFNANVTIARKGSQVMKEVIDEVETVLSKDSIDWGENGPVAYSRVFVRHPDRVRAMEYGVADGWAGKVYSNNGPFDSDAMWDGVRIMHLYGASTPFPLTNITPEYINQSGCIYAKTVRNILTEEEWNPSLATETIAHDTHYNPLFDYLKTHDCRKIMEIGTYCGRNAVAMIRASRAREEEITYYGFDMFEKLDPQVASQEFSGMYSNPPPVEEVQRKIESETKAKAILQKGDTKKVLPEAVSSLPIMDLIYVDGGHSIPTVQSDWDNVQKLMGSETVVFFDDYFDELPMRGCKFLETQLSGRYEVSVCQETDIYQHSFGNLKDQLMMVKKLPVVDTVTCGGKRFHLLGLPHIPTNKVQGLACAYSQKCIKMAKMLKSLGHTVLFYGVQGSEVECDEFIQVSTKDVLRRTYGDYDWRKQTFKHAWGDKAFQVFNNNTIKELGKRMSPTDYLLIPWGGDKPVYDALATTDPNDDSKLYFSIEMGIGYEGTFSHLRVFESYAWMHHVVGIQAGLQGHGDCNGNGYDVVIPNYFDPSDFEFCDDKDNYFFFLGRVISRKGVLIAKDVCEAIGAKLLVAGQDGGEAVNGVQIMDILKASPNVEFVGFADLEKRKQLLKKAKALFVPTVYIGPFEGVSIEAGFSGTPVITTDFGAFTENVIHGVTGYRCRTMKHFIRAAENIGNINPRDCYEFAVKNFSLDRVRLMYEEYFNMLMDFKTGNGWYTTDGIADMNWLRRYYPGGDKCHT